MKKIILIIAFIFIGLVTIYLYNYFSLQATVNHRLLEDSRNEGIVCHVNYKNFVSFKTLVFNIKEISSDKAPIDVFRVFLQSAEALDNKEFELVYLASKGKNKFFVKGEYFKKLGQEYDFQNPVYTARTFSENLFLISGQAAYSTWTGGLLGVLSQQMDDLNDAYREWFLNDFMTDY